MGSDAVTLVAWERSENGGRKRRGREEIKIDKNGRSEKRGGEKREERRQREREREREGCNTHTQHVEERERAQETYLRQGQWVL